MEKKLNLDYHGLNLNITLRYTPGLKGRAYTYTGDPGTPPEYPSVEILSVKVGNIDLLHFLSETYTECYVNKPHYVMTCLEEVEELCIRHIHDQ